MGIKSSKVAAEEGKVGPVMKPNKERKCRDILWLILFIVYMVGMVVVFLLGYSNGDAARLLYAIDSQSNQCGGKGSVCYAGKECGKNAVYPRVDLDFAEAIQRGTNVADPVAVLKIPFTSFCLSSCPEGFEDLDEDGQIRDWVCDYSTTKVLHAEARYAAVSGEDWDDKEIPTLAAKVDLEYCLANRGNGPFGAAMLTDTMGPNNVQCRTLLGGCWKMYVPERNLFFRCVPQTESNSTCSLSPYLDYIGESVTTKQVDGKTVVRTAEDDYCGLCIDPENDANGNPMNPNSKDCKAKRVYSTSATIEATPNPLFEQVNTWTALLVRWMGDVSLSSTWILLTGAVGAMLIGCVWLILLRFFASIFVWTVIWSLFYCFAFLTCQLLVYGKVISTDEVMDILKVFDDEASNATATTIIESMNIFETEAKDQEELYRILGYIMAGVTGVYLLFVLTLQRKIRLAVQILKEATKVIAAIPSLLFLPLITASLSVLASVYWVYGAMLISSSGAINKIVLPGVANITTRRMLEGETDAIGEAIMNEFESSDLNTWLWIYHLFGYLWLNQTIQAISACVIAGAVASHYWASEVEKEKKSKMPAMPVLASLKRTFRFHLGSLMFGSFVIALVQLVQFLLAYLDKQTQGLQKKNKLIKIVMKLVQCCLWCFKQVLQFVTKHAFIQIALKGTSFCVATKDGFMIMLTNLSMIGVATVVNNLVNLFAKLVITAGASSLCWICVTQLLTGDDAPSNVFIPVIVTAMLSWFVGGLFMSVYGLAVDTILICFCEDQKANDGTPNKPYYMSKGLQRIANKSNKMYKTQVATKQAANADDDGPEDALDVRTSGGTAADGVSSQKQLL